MARPQIVLIISALVATIATFLQGCNIAECRSKSVDTDGQCKKVCDGEFHNFSAKLNKPCYKCLCGPSTYCEDACHG